MNQVRIQLFAKALRGYGLSLVATFGICGAFLVANFLETQQREFNQEVQQLNGQLGQILSNSGLAVEELTTNPASSEARGAFLSGTEALKRIDQRYEKLGNESLVRQNATLMDEFATFKARLQVRISDQASLSEFLEKTNGAKISDQVHSELMESQVLLAARSDKFLSGLSADRIQKAKSHYDLTLWLSLSLLATTLFQVFGVMRPLIRQIDKREQENEIHSLTLNHAIEEISSRSAELQEQQATMTEALAEQQIIGDNFKMASIRLQKLLGSIPLPCIGVDVHGAVYEWNDAAQKIFGYTHFELFETSLADRIFDHQDGIAFSEKLKESVEQDAEIRLELPASGRDGQRVMLEWSLMPMRGSNGEISSVLITGVDITERTLRQEQLSELAYKDALTGLCNRRAFLEKLNDMYTSVSAESPLSVVLMDVDKFKVYNDTYGHPAGDALLRRIGELWREICPESYVPGRYGGEEFICLLPGVDNKLACEFADEMRSNIEAFTLDLHGSTASFGVSTAKSDEYAPQEIIEFADKALYYSKHNGRNRVTSMYNVPELGLSEAA